ncbi:MAG: thiamine-phosphate kinase, partial [Alphaproteobacteria bacterium]
MDEFDLIRRCFSPLATTPGADGLRDDVAEIAHDGGDRLIVTADTIVEGVHFLPDDPIETVAAKLVRVNVSDIIAKGGKPDGALLMLTWPARLRLAEAEAFAVRLGLELAHWGAHLLGGDTTSTEGPLTLSLTLLGRCGWRGPVRRSGATIGDDLWVTGTIGDGWLGLQATQGKLAKLDAADRASLIDAYRVPRPPPLAFARIIADHANASIDVSDGLVADAAHVAEASGVAIIIDWMDAPLSDAARRWLADTPGAVIGGLLAGGDDYQ